MKVHLQALWLTLIFLALPAFTAEQQSLLVTWSDEQSLRGIVEVTQYLMPEACKVAQNINFQRAMSAEPQPALDEKFFYQYRTCEVDIRRTCDETKNSSIPKETLEALFKRWSHDPLLRMRMPERLSYSRAYLLSQDLSKAGYATDLIEIIQSPVIVGVLRDEENKPSAYFDYGAINPLGKFSDGNHWAVQITVDNEDNNYDHILDPQFFNEPLLRETYFRSLTGQDCKQRVLGDASGSIWDCVYRSYASNATREVPLVGESSLFHIAGCEFPQTEAEITSVRSLTPDPGNAFLVIPEEVRSEADIPLALLRRAFEARKSQLDRMIQDNAKELEFIRGESLQLLKPTDDAALVEEREKLKAMMNEFRTP